MCGPSQVDTESYARVREHDSDIPPIGYTPEKDAAGKDKWPLGEEKVWKNGMRAVDESTCPLFTRSSRTYRGIAVEDITKSFANHVQTSLARQPYNLGAYREVDCAGTAC